MLILIFQTKSVKKTGEYLNVIYPQLFEYCLMVGLRPLVDDPGYEPVVLHKFPENVSFDIIVFFRVKRIMPIDLHALYSTKMFTNLLNKNL